MSRRFNHSHCYNGFSLFEIIVVLVLISIMMLMVPPMFSAGVSNAEMKTSARKIAALLRKERSAAILSRQTASFKLDVHRKVYQSKQQRKAVEIPQALSVAMTTGHTLVDNNDTGAINFYPDGSSTGGRIVLKNKNQTATVDVEWLTGKVTVYD